MLYHWTIYDERLLANRTEVVVLFVFMAVVAATRLMLAVNGIYPAVPYGLCLTFGLIAGPFAIAALWLGTTRLHPALAVVFGIAALFCYSYIFLWIALSIVIVLVNARKLTGPGAIALLSVALTLFYWAVFDANYLVAWLTRDRLSYDAMLIRIDRAVYTVVLGKSSYAGIFPLVGGRLFEILQNAYMSLFGEMCLLIFVMRRESRRFFGTMAIAYGLGIGIFYLFPSVGPSTYQPDSFAGFAGTAIASLGRSEYTEYHALLSGKPLSGIGYFIAVPSLHVLACILSQGFLRRSRTLFFAFMPINIAIVISTFALGQHYLLDVVTGGALAAALWPLTAVTKPSPETPGPEAATGSVTANAASGKCGVLLST